MTIPTTIPITLHADPEHRGLRLAVILFLFVSMIVIYFLLNFIWSLSTGGFVPDYSFIVTCISSILLGLVAIWGIEMGLKKVWHSGRAITLDEQGIRVQDRGAAPYLLDWQGHMNNLFWYFVLEGYKRGGRERRVPKNSLCLAIQVQEGEHRLIVYTYLSRKNAERLLVDNGRNSFVEIQPTELYQATVDSGYFAMPGRPDKIPADLLSGKEGPYWLAEQRRWTAGYELTPKDFEIFLQTVFSVQ
ncbi:MAG: BCD family MFS transporter [Chloroflexi bacterium]|nr:BCD family MFS transporter [Chloroflexota bacterium]